MLRAEAGQGLAKAWQNLPQLEKRILGGGKLAPESFEWLEVDYTATKAKTIFNFLFGGKIPGAWRGNRPASLELDPAPREERQRRPGSYIQLEILDVTLGNPLSLSM